MEQFYFQKKNGLDYQSATKFTGKFFGQKLTRTNDFLGHLPVRTNVYLDECFPGQMSFSANAGTKICLPKQVSPNGANVSTHKCLKHKYLK